MASTPQTRPAPVFGVCNQPRPQRISFDVSAGPKEVSFGLNRDGLKSVLIDRSSASCLMERMPPLRMGASQPMHEERQLMIFHGPHDEVPMVRHCTICQESDRHSLQCFAQHFFERQVVRAGAEQARASNCSIEHVIREYAGRSASASGHGGWGLGSSSRKSSA